MTVRAATWRASLALVLVVGGCGGGGGTPTPSPEPSGTAVAGPSSPGTSPSSPGASDRGSASPSGTAGEFSNPVLDANFADPFVFAVDDTWYAYATGNLTYNIQVASSPDLVTWSRPAEALPRLPLWQPNSRGLTWAPEVIETPAGFVMHYTARYVQEAKQCLSVAVAPEPEGPFVDESDGPLTCQIDLGGSIDSAPFKDEDGSLWLVWKNDGNCCGEPTRFYLQGLEPSATELVEGDPVDLGVVNDETWEDHLIEAPTLVRREDRYYLFYSANDYASESYAVGYATSDRLAGPYVDAPENPILRSEGRAAGPGHQSIMALDDGSTWIAYHAWDAGRVGDDVAGRRALWLDELLWEDGKPVVDGPDEGPQPAPLDARG